MAETTNGTPRTDLDFNKFRTRLMEEKALAERTITGTQAAEGGDGMNTTGTDRAELADYDDNDPADGATELFIREQDMALVGNAEEILAKINRALEKLDEGTYGLSDQSGEVIPTERLEAIPYATLTTAEQEVQDEL